jgi:hypothetical protein
MRHLCPGKGAERVDLDNLSRSSELKVHERAVRRVDARVVHQQVEASELLDCPSDRLILVVGIVGLPGDSKGNIARSKSIDSFIEWLLLAGSDNDTSPLGDQPFCDREADTATGAGDDRGLASESPGHFSGPFSGSLLLRLCADAPAVTCGGGRLCRLRPPAGRAPTVL